MPLRLTPELTCDCLPDPAGRRQHVCMDHPAQRPGVGARPGRPDPNMTPPIRPLDNYARSGAYVLLFGPSGYRGTKHRCHVCRYDPDYRPLQPWVDFSGTSFLDDGEPPYGYLPLPEEDGATLVQEPAPAPPPPYRRI